MATRKDKAQPIVGDRSALPIVSLHIVLQRRTWLFQRGVLLETLALPPPGVDSLALGGGDKPRGGTRRNPVAWPPLESDRECVLECLLGEIEIAQRPDQRR